MTVWWLTINRAMGNSYLGLKHRKVIAQGWPQLGDLSILASNFDSYWRDHRHDFENVIQHLARPVYPGDAAKPPAALLNLYNLMTIAKGDFLVAVESAQGAGTVMGICQADRNAWESYRPDDPNVYDYAHSVCFPVEWVDWDATIVVPPNPPAMIAGVQLMGTEQAAQIENSWRKLISKVKRQFG